LDNLANNSTKTVKHTYISLIWVWWEQVLESKYCAKNL